MRELRWLAVRNTGSHSLLLPVYIPPPTKRCGRLALSHSRLSEAYTSPCQGPYPTLVGIWVYGKKKKIYIYIYMYVYICMYIYGWFSRILPTGSLTFFQRSTILQQFQSFSYLKFVYWRNRIHILAAFFSLYYHIIQQFILSLILSRYIGYKLKCSLQCYLYVHHGFFWNYLPCIIPLT